MNMPENDKFPRRAAVAARPLLADTGLDWQGLRTRLGGVYTARRVGLEGNRILLRNGSFDYTSAHALTSLAHGLTDVNLDALEVGNLLGASNPAAAGSPYRQWLR